MKPDLVLGIDEAGRGPGIGPMVLAGVAIDEDTASLLDQAGVKDSKAFGSNASARRVRGQLALLVYRHAAWVATEICEVAEIDEYVARGALNHLERERARQLMTKAPSCTRIVADGRALFSPLAGEFPHLEAHDRAESVHLAVVLMLI